MKYKYYHEGDFRRILKLVSDNYFNNALVLFQDYFERYPSDYVAYVNYADLLIKMGKTDQAEQVLNSIVINSKLKPEFFESFDLIKMKLLVCQKKYEEAYKFFLENFDILENDKRGTTSFSLFIRKKLNLLTESDMSQKYYLFSQIVNYSDELCLEHLTRHQYSYENDNLVQFLEYFPMKDVYYQIKNMLPMDSNNRIYNSIIDSQYVFKYDNCGKVEGKLVDYILVVTLHDTDSIITMYPYKNSERIPYIDLTPVIENEVFKSKRLSQIDKFNQRYGKIVDKK